MTTGDRAGAAPTPQPMQVPVPHALALAEQYRQSGHRAVAEDLCRQVLQVRPRDPEALHLMAIMAHQGGDLVAAIDYLKRAIAAKGNVPLFLSNLCEMCRQAGRLDEAIVAGTRAIKLHPNYPPALNNLAIAHFDREEFSTAERYCRRALALDPSFAEAHNNLANALRAQHKFEQSIPGYNRAIELRPGYADAIANLGSVLHIVGKLDEAMSTFRWALALDPRQADARTGVGILQLLNANFEAGWSDYEWRLLTQQSRHRTPPGPVWDGSNPAGRRILVYGEQGFGDALQFCRYLPMLIERGATVALAIPSAVAGLIAESIPGLEVWSSGTLPSYDCHCALLSLPHRFGTRSGSIPRPIAYLRPPREAIARWASRIVGPELKVGLVWTGNPKHVNNPGRSTTADSLLPLLSIEGIRFFSLQVGASAGELTKLSKGSVPDLSPDLTDYSETAGAVANLDLVVTIDTSVAHLTGAIGKPAWVILSSVPDWRWMLDREDNPWYPTMRLFRPQAPRDWSGVIERVAAELRAVLGGDRSRLTPFLRSSG